MAGQFVQFETLLREFISPSIHNLELEDDDPIVSLIGTMNPVTLGGARQFDTGTSEFPAGYEARFRVKVQSGGRVAGGTFAGNSLVMMGKDSHLPNGQAADAKYLDPTMTPLPAWVPISMILKRIKGGVVTSHEQMAAALISQPLDEVAGNAVEDAVRKVRSYSSNAFYSDGTATIAQVNDSTPPTITETAGGVEVTIDAGTFNRFQKGDIIVAGTNANPRVQIAGAINGRMNVVAVDPDLRTIKLQSRPGEGSIVLVDNAHLMLEGTYVFDSTGTNATNSLVPEGAESLLINTGTFPGSTSPKFTSGLNVADHTELKSFINDTTSAQANPTMQEVTLLLDKILDTETVPPSAWIAERSLWTLHSQLEKENNSMVQVPMGATFQASGGVAGPVLSHQEHRFQRFNSSRVRPNSILAIDPKSWMKFMPLGDRAIHWAVGAGGIAGAGSIFRAVTDGTQMTELLDAPFDAYLQFGCMKPRANFRRLGLKTQRDV